MFAYIKLALRYTSILASLALAACGGGGGSSDAFSVFPTSLTFTAIQNGAIPAAQLVTGTLHSNSVGYIEIRVSSELFNAYFDITGETTGRLTVYPVTTNVAPGTYNSTITVIGCASYGCSTGQVSGSPKTVNLTYTIQPQTGLRVTPQSLSFSQARGSSTPAAQSFALSDLSNASFSWNASISYLSGSGWLNINGANQTSGSSLPASLSLSINPLTALGNYSAVVHITDNNSTIDIPVSYAVREPQVTAIPTTLIFSAVSHNPSATAAQLVTLNSEASLPVNYSTTIVYGAGASGWLTLPTTGLAPENISVNTNTTSLNAGTYTATLLITTATQNVSIPVTYTVRAPQVTRSPTQLNFNAFRYGQVPSAQSVSINTEYSISVHYTTSVSYGAGATGWLTVTGSGTAPASLSVTTNTTNLNAGSYNATITVQPAYGSSSFTVGVTYQVQNANLTVSANRVDYEINAISVTSDLTQSIMIGDTGIPLSWSASSLVPWLSVGTSSGTTLGNGTTTSLPLSLNPSIIENLSAGIHTGGVTVSYTRPDTSVVTVQITIVLTMNLPVVNYASPYVALSNSSKEIIIRGSGFNHATNSDINFGSNVVSSFNIVNDTEIRVTHPSLTVGNYPVTITNQLNLTANSADLVVIDPVQFDYAFIPSTMYPGRVIYDAERRAIYSVRNYSGPGAIRIERHRFINGTWQADSLPLSNLLDIALTPDGKEIIAISNNRVYHIDPVALTISSQFSLDFLGYPFNIMSFNTIGMANDGIALVSLYGYGIMSYDIRSKMLTTIYNGPYCPQFGISGNGNRIVIGESCTSGYLIYYDSSTRQYISTGNILGGSMIHLNRDGTRTEIWGSVYDNQFNLEGNMSADGRTNISQDGSRGYSFALRTYYGGPATVKVYDLNSRDVSGVFNQVGADISIPDHTGEYNFDFIATPDGRNLILYGDEGVIIQPLP
jgi:hypothetical protein